MHKRGIISLLLFILLCLNEHKLRNDFEKMVTRLERPLYASHFGMKFISISLRRAKQMCKIICNRALFILHKNVSPSHFHDVIEKKYLILTQKKKKIMGNKMLNSEKFWFYPIPP